MTISVDSVKTIDSFERFKNLPKQNSLLDSSSSNNVFVRKETKKVIRRSFSPSTQKYTTDLSNAAQNFLYKMWGAIFVESEVGKGSTFSFTLPILKK